MAFATAERINRSLIWTIDETEDVGWKFWKVFRRDKIADLVTDAIFDEANDLVVDTAHMTTLGARGEMPAANVWRYPEKSGVWHCSYFQQPKTIDRIEDAFGRS